MKVTGCVVGNAGARGTPRRNDSRMRRRRGRRCTRAGRCGRRLLRALHVRVDANSHHEALGLALLARLAAALSAAHDDQLHLGATTEQVLSTVSRVYLAAARTPLRVGGRRHRLVILVGLCRWLLVGIACVRLSVSL
jgi:hypothetical protein